MIGNNQSSLTMIESHLHIATSIDGIPQNNGNPPPGQFDYGEDQRPTYHRIHIQHTMGPILGQHGTLHSGTCCRMDMGHLSIRLVL